MEQLKTEEYLLNIDKHPESVYVLHEKKERRFPVHRHTKGQLTYVEGGLAYLNMPDRDLVVPAHHYVWLPAGVEHFLKIRTHATAIRSIYFYTHDDDKANFYKTIGIYPINNLLIEMIKYSERWEEDIFPDEKGYSFLSALKDLLPDVSKQALPFIVPTTTNERIRSILLYIREHIADPLTLKDVSDEFGMSERTLARLLQANVNISFYQYLKSIRMVYAIELILQTDKTLSEIAYETGYGSIAAFSKAFYQLTGSRPSEFKRS
jgi:AraC-like DNA-binding protein/quercetin dioxygenase-like cupin family protein